MNDYIAANKGKLSNEQIAKLQKDLATQTEIAREQMISTKNSDDYNYVMNLRKKSGSSGKSSSSASVKSQKRSSSNSSKKSSSSGKNNPKNYTEGAKRRQTNTNSAKKTSEERRGSEGSLEDLRKRAQRDVLKGRR